MTSVARVAATVVPVPVAMAVTVATVVPVPTARVPVVTAPAVPVPTARAVPVATTVVTTSKPRNNTSINIASAEATTPQRLFYTLAQQG